MRLTPVGHPHPRHRHRRNLHQRRSAGEAVPVAFSGHGGCSCLGAQTHPYR